LEPSTATEILNFLTNSIMGAMSQLETWAWAVFTCLFVIRCIVDFTRSLHRTNGTSIETSVIFDAASSFVVTAIVVSLYFSASFTIMDWFRQAGMALSGADMDTVDIGELFRQREIVSDRIYETVDSFKELGIWDQVKLVPEILMLNGLGGVVFIEYFVLALIAIWVYAKFCLGFLTGAVFIGGLSWNQSFSFGMRSISYVLSSTQPLMLLAFMQGISARLIMEAPVMTGEALITVPALWEIFMMLLFTIFLCLAAVSVPREWLGGIVGSSGAPDLSRTASHIASGAGGIMGGAKMIANAHQSIGNRLFGGGGGGGGSRSIPSPSSSASNAGAALPKLTFNSTANKS
jgi:hypothetical protein